ncbi:LysR family transcriptional regulator [Novosphingobium aquimarinum]|uniref:LysR family transcriptional regulator n=1 Tax=Novosphingobium aquimarinum TaxID=2682494 RepID=UPI0018DDB8FE|nr:LysR family transcriptional regulator [Novosphingobium aquimarinum]
MLYSRAAVYFDEVARRGSIKKASETLNIAPSAIDRQVSQLEERLGVALFERLRTGIRLTAAGEILIDTIRRGRREIERAESVIDDLRGLRRGRVSLAIAEGAAEFLSQAIATFHDAYPNIDFDLHVAEAQTVLTSLQSGATDIGLTFNPPAEPGIRVERSLIYQMGAVVLPSDPLAAQGAMTLGSLADRSLILPDHSLTLRALFDQAWQKIVGDPLRAVISTNSISVLKSSVGQGLGIGVLTHFDVWKEVRSGELAFIPFDDQKIPLSVLSALSLAGRALSSPAALFMQHLSNVMASQSEPSI